MKPVMLDQRMGAKIERKQSSNASFDALYDAEFGSVYRYARARVGHSDGEEVTAEVFHAAALAHADGQGSTVTPAWLMAVTRNKVIDRWRRAERHKAKRHLVWPREKDAVEFPEHWTQSGTREAVLGALDQMKTRHRTLLILHHVDGMSVPEIASALDESTRSVESALARARSSFRRNYDGDQI
jgi:RNA polymerase sigma-70 factor (ECF subfamily)